MTFLNSFYCFCHIRFTLPPVGDLPPVQSWMNLYLKWRQSLTLKKIRSASDSEPHMEVAWIRMEKITIMTKKQKPI